jgi:hypothetical protein
MPDILHAAKLLIDQRSEGTPLRAAQRADELLEAGDMEGSVGVGSWARSRSYSGGAEIGNTAR